MKKNKIKFPVMDLKMIPMEKIEANDYNPNVVATPEMKLLKLSIEEDGYTMPIVVYYDHEKDKYIIVDGFHRYSCGLHFGIDEIPATVIDKPLENRMASTIRHNRARGTHQIKNMSEIVLDFVKAGWTDSEIAKHLGMDAEELLRLKQTTGLAEAFLNHEFSKSWEEFTRKHNVEIKKK